MAGPKTRRFPRDEGYRPSISLPENPHRFRRLPPVSCCPEFLNQCCLARNKHPKLNNLKIQKPMATMKLTNLEIAPYSAPSPENREKPPAHRSSGRSATWKQRSESLQREVSAVWKILMDPRTPWYARIIAACTVSYLFSPVQLIPSFIPVIGLLDDFAVLWLGSRLIRRLAPAAVVRDSIDQAAAAPVFSTRAMTPKRRMTAMVIGAAWLTAAVAVIFWLYR